MMIVPVSHVWHLLKTHKLQNKKNSLMVNSYKLESDSC